MIDDASLPSAAIQLADDGHPQADLLRNRAAIVIDLERHAIRGGMTVHPAMIDRARADLREVYDELQSDKEAVTYSEKNGELE